MVGLDEHRPEEEDEEPPVDHRVHESGLAILQHGAHQHCIAQTDETLFP